LEEKKSVNNTFLDRDNYHKNIYYVKYIPSILINGKVFWGNWNADNLLEAICSSLVYKPHICFSYGGLPGIHTTLNKKSFFTSNMLILMVSGSFIISLVIFLVCKFQIQQNINNNLDSSNFGHKINTVVTSYLALKDTKKPEGSSSNLNVTDSSLI